MTTPTVPAPAREDTLAAARWLGAAARWQADATAGRSLAVQLRPGTPTRAEIVEAAGLAGDVAVVSVAAALRADPALCAALWAGRDGGHR